MEQITIKDAIRDLKNFTGNSNLSLVDVLRPWMIITDLDFHDALHMTYADIIQGLMTVHAKLNEVLDVLDENQIRETACRCLKTIVVCGAPIFDGTFSVAPKQTLTWDGSMWTYMMDPKFRQRGSSPNYLEALTYVREALEAEGEIQS